MRFARPRATLHAMASASRWLVRTLPPPALGVLALAGLFVAAAALSALAAPRGRGLAATAPSPTAAPSPATPPPAGRPYALGAVPEAGGVLLQANGVWRYSGAGGVVLPVAASGGAARPVTRATQLLARSDDGGFILADAASGNASGMGLPAGSVDADWIGAGRPWAYVERDLVTIGFGVRAETVPVPFARFLRLSPDGRRMVVGASTAASDLASRLLAVDFAGSRPRELVSLPTAGRAPGMGGSISPAGWSPDGRLFAFFVVSTSGSLNADGVGLRIADAERGTVTDLGTVLYGLSRLSWTAPHTLAYVSGGGRETWTNKTLRLWSPEAGARDVTGAGEVGLNPSWSADGSALYFIRAASARYDPLEFFAGKRSGDRRIARLDVATGRTTLLPSAPDVVAEGVRPSRDGTMLLAIARPVTAIPSLDALRTTKVPLDLVLIDPRTSRTIPLVRLDDDAGFGYYGSYAGPEAMAWSR